MMLRRAVFLDRDGVLNKNVFNPATGEYESPGRPEDFELFPHAIPAVRRLRDLGFLLFLVSNQPNYAKGKSTLKQLQDVHDRLAEELEKADVRFAGFFYCFHHPNGIIPSHSGPCECRKPSPFFLLKAANEHDLSLPDSWMIGDRGSDIQAGIAAGVRTIRVKADHPVHDPKPDLEANYWAEDLLDAVNFIGRAVDRGTPAADCKR
jgi:D-glycero-D-manno-heptose 1,7-bisphosphate phosphatase